MPEIVGERGGQLRRRAALLVHEPAHALAVEQGNGRRARRYAAGDRERRPVRVGLVLGEAEGVFAGIALHRAVDLARPAATDIADDELEGPADGGVGAVALAERVQAPVHADAPCDGAVHDDHRPREMGRAEQAVHGEARYQRGFDRRQHGREIFGPAAGHDGVDGRLLHGAGRKIGRNLANDLVGRPRRAGQHPGDAQVGRRHDRQAVGPAPVERRLHRVVMVLHDDLPRGKRDVSEAHRQPFRHAELDRQRPAAGLVLRQVPAESPVAGQRPPFGLVPTDGARGLPAAAEADQGRHGLDVESVGELQVAVMPGIGALGKGGVVLRDRHGARRRQFREDRLDEDAGRAVALDHRQQAVGRKGVAPACHSSASMFGVRSLHGIGTGLQFSPALPLTVLPRKGSVSFCRCSQERSPAARNGQDRPPGTA